MRRKLVYGFLALACLALAYVLMQSVERYEVPVDRGWSAAALRNPFLAAEQFLKGQGIKARSTDRANVLSNLSADSTLLIRDTDLLKNAKFADELKAWLQAGGHLVVQSSGYEETEAFLWDFDIYMLRQEENIEPDDAGEVVDSIQDVSMRYDQWALRSRTIREGGGIDEVLRKLEARTDPLNITRVHFSDNEHELFIDFRADGTLYHPQAYGKESNSPYPLYYWAGTESGIAFMQLEVDAGLLSVMVDMNIWNSTRIGMFDHAHLLRGLVEHSGEVVFLTGVRSLSLMTMMWANFFEVIVAALLFLFAWIAYRARRFGPVMLSAQDGRRSFAEHIQATGYFMWRNNQSDDLLSAVRCDLGQLMQRRFPGSETLSDAERLSHLAQHTRFDIAELHSLMYGPVPDDELQFVNMIKSLQKIRKAL